MHRKPRRDMHIERLEDRQLLAGAQLIGIQPNDGALLQTGDIRNVAPADLTFRFDENQIIDSASLGNSTTPGGIQITRSNLDGVFAPAKVSSDFGTGTGGVLLEFSAVRLGDDQNGITLAITKSDFGGPGLPGISVIGRTINIGLNVNQNYQTTAADLVGALQNSAEASNLITARIVRGSPSQNIAATAPANSSLVLTGANDIVVRPGYIGVGAEPALNEVVFRFAGQVPDDVYRIDIFGTGSTPLRNVNGERYLDGKNSTVVFELDLAPQIISVVPQPVLRQANGSLVQDRNKIAVYFNNDDLNQASAQNPQFYQLIYTNDTLENTDDLVFNPIAVQYSADKDMAILTFASDLATLAPQGPGTFRLRIGTDEPQAAPPIIITPQSSIQGVYNGATIDFLGQGEQWGQAVRIEVVESDFGFDSLPRVRAGPRDYRRVEHVHRAGQHL
jgi:large repetitive protein